MKKPFVIVGIIVVGIALVAIPIVHGIFRLLATDEEGVEFWMHWNNDELEDHYHDEWNRVHYGKAVVAYQDRLRDRYFAQMPYVASYEYYPYDSYLFYRGPFAERFFESAEDAVDGSRSCCFDTTVTFTGIDLDTADGEELQQFAESLADSMIRIREETGYYEVKINSFQYWAYIERSDTYTAREDLVDSIVKKVKLDQKIAHDKNKTE